MFHQNIVHISFNSQILNNTPAQRRLKGFLDANLYEKKIKISFVPHADLEPENKIDVDASLYMKYLTDKTFK